MSIFKTKKKFRISERDPEFKVRYLGNVQTALMKGDGCVDKATTVLWNNFAKSSGTVGLDMTITVCTAGMKAITAEQGLTEYRAHRISYCIAHPNFPRLFVWVYRHEGKRMKVELRCHAVLCKNERKDKAMALALHEKLSFSLNEFMRDKKRRQNSRLTLQKTNSLTSLPGSTNTYGTSLRQKMLSTGQKFKPSIEQSSTAPKLGKITESFDEEKEEEELMAQREAESLEEDTGIDVEGEEPICDEIVVDIYPRANEEDDSSISSQNEGRGTSSEDGEEAETLANGIFELEIGNDIDELKRDARVLQDSDDNSSESGFSEQDNKESSSTGSNGNASNSSGGSLDLDSETPEVVDTNGYLQTDDNCFDDKTLTDSSEDAFESETVTCDISAKTNGHVIMNGSAVSNSHVISADVSPKVNGGITKL